METLKRIIQIILLNLTIGTITGVIISLVAIFFIREWRWEVLVLVTSLVFLYGLIWGYDHSGNDFFSEDTLMFYAPMWLKGVVVWLSFIIVGIFFFIFRLAFFGMFFRGCY